MELIVDKVSKSFQDKVVLKEASAVFEEGKITGLLGQNGAGKTTLFRLINQDIDLDSGECRLRDGENELPLSASHVGMVMAENLLPEFLTGYEFVQFFLDIRESPSTLSPDDYLEMVEIDVADRHRIIKGYSSGMQSKLSILAVVILAPKVILLDEPLTAVDVLAGIQLKKLLKTLKKDHIILLSTHILQLAYDLCDEIVVLKDGQLTPLAIDRDDSQFEGRIVQVLAGETDD